MSKTTKTKARSCDGKARHESREAAQGQIAALRRGFGNVRVTTYRCKHCKGWHVGHLPRRKR